MMVNFSGKRTSFYLIIPLWVLFIEGISQVKLTGELNCTNFTKDYSDLIEYKLKSPKIKLYLDPLLHDCMNAHSYNKRQVPIKVGQIREPYQIYYSFHISEVLDLDSDGTLMTTMICNFEWKDEHRIWKLNDIPIHKIFIPSSEVWYPRFLVDNCESDDCFLTPDNNTYVQIVHQGLTSYSMTKIIESTCNLNLVYFPFDQQLCFMNIRLTTMSIPVTIIPEMSIFRMYDIDSDEWEVLSVKDWPNNFTRKIYDRQKDGSYVDSKQLDINKEPGIIISVALKRYSNYYVYNLVWPVVIISAMGFFTIFLPPTSDGKINMAVTVLLGFLFIQTIIADLFPRTESSPYLATYTFLALTLSSSNLIGSIAVVGLFNLAGKVQPPKIIYKVLPFLQLIALRKPWITIKIYKWTLYGKRIRNRAPKAKEKDKETNIPLKVIAGTETELKPLPEEMKIKDQFETKKIKETEQKPEEKPKEKAEEIEIENENKTDEKEDKQEDEKDEAELERSKGEAWNEAALSINRLCSFAYLVGTILIFLIFFAPIVFQRDVTKLIEVPDISGIISQSIDRMMNTVEPTQITTSSTISNPTTLPLQPQTES